MRELDGVIIHDEWEDMLIVEYTDDETGRSHSVFAVVDKKNWGDWKGTSGPILSQHNSIEEALFFVKGVQDGAFIPYPMPWEYDEYPGLMEHVHGGA